MQALVRASRPRVWRPGVQVLRGLCRGAAPVNGTAEVAKSALYTRGGDSGHSSLFGGARARKDAPVFRALGALDEANAQLGLARALIPPEHADLQQELQEVQSALMDAGASVATPRDASAERAAVVRFDDELVNGLETAIDRLDAEAGPLTRFILPGGGHAAAQLHVARAVVRRAERDVATLVLAGEADPCVGVYVNRLSDYVFAAARVVAKRGGKEEVLYESRRRRERGR